MASIDTTYFENLAATGITCPHEDAFVPDGSKTYFRVLKSSVINSECFLPTAIKTDKPLPDEFDDCIGKSVSIYDSLEGMINGFFKLPHNRGKKKHIGILQLKSNDGMLKQTFRKSHHSWWRSQAFDIATVAIKEIEL
ncbi:hypothetical protein TH53_23885 [Pedobacter lusitanus]|uniref:Uncharacterized protein n=1 Tax=Pedobacter lusitanus TaxID=1503925 RepID=A0A0D0EZU9_9SPHI|nr:hypothetical protein [Pedobacter lusitanus]KIO74873.1 hypothetical protein TH53_23885 [Pedobacter lusitanus]